MLSRSRCDGSRLGFDVESTGDTKRNDADD